MLLVDVVEAYSGDVLVRVETGSQGYRQSVWVPVALLRKPDEEPSA